MFLENEGGRIVYDDRAIDALLDRSKEGIIEKESGMDDYLSSFKVSHVSVHCVHAHGRTCTRTHVRTRANTLAYIHH